MNREPGVLLPVLLCLGFFPGVFSRSASGQEPEAIRDGPTCPECRVVLDSVAVLDGRRSEHVGWPVAFARLSDGRLLLTPGFDLSLVAVFNRWGSFVGRLGGQGEGPGEFRSVHQIREGPGDTIRIYDGLSPRVSVFSSELQHLETRRMEVPVGPGASGLFELPEGRLLTQNNLPLEGHAGHPVHLMERDGTLLRSFGGESRPFIRGQESWTWRSMARASEDRFWLAPHTPYVIELWDLSGRKHRELVRDRSWPETEEGCGMNHDRPEEPPTPCIWGLRPDQDGLLWVLLYVADQRWKEAVGPVRGHWGLTTGVTDRHRYYDSVVEILDPARRRIVARTRFDRVLSRLYPDGLILSYRENETGFPVVEVWRLRLVGP